MITARANLIRSTTAFTISSAGSVLLHIVLAVSVYESTSSAVLTAMFISLQWLPAMLVVLYRSDWDHGMHPLRRWFVLDLVSAFLTLVILATMPNYYAMAGLLLVRGIVDHINRINKTVAARVLFPKDDLGPSASMLQSGNQVGMAAAAIIGVFAAKAMGLATAIIIDAATFAVSAALIRACVSVEAFAAGEQPRRPLRSRVVEYGRVLEQKPQLMLCAILMPVTATFFQGSYSVLQPIFPIEHLGLGASAVSASYVMASVAIVFGSSAFTYFCRRSRLFARPGAWVRALAGGLSIVAAGAYLGSVSTTNYVTCAVAFSLMVFFFEFLWMMGHVGIVELAPEGQLGSVFGISFALGCFFASLLTALLGLLLDLLSNDYIVLVGCVMATYFVVLFATIALSSRRSPRPSPIT